MVKVLPQRFNPDLLARDDTRFEVSLPQSKLARLAALLLAAQNDVHCSAMFSRRKRHVYIRGRIQTVVAMECQRCLEPMDFQIDEPYELVFVEDEAAAEALAKQFDPVILDEHGHIGVIDLFEDEIMLHVPAIPKHQDNAACRVSKTEFGELPESVSEEKPNPFEALKDLRLN